MKKAFLTILLGFWKTVLEGESPLITVDKTDIADKEWSYVLRVKFYLAK